MSFLSVYIHCVWNTKNRIPYLNSVALRKQVWQHIRETAREKGIFVDFVDGYNNHCHCLISLGADQTIQETIRHIKGESSFWINQNRLTVDHFGWQNGYWAMGVSQSLLPRVRRYIENQESHHGKTSFDAEVKEIESKHTCWKKVEND